jgi:hypothetical protein
VLVKVGKYQLEFQDEDVSKFRTDWEVGIDNPPFSKVLVDPEEAGSLEIVYWISFFGEGATRTTVKVKKNRQELFI